MDNKCLKNEEKTVSSSYPPRSLSNCKKPGNQPQWGQAPEIFYKENLKVL